MISTRDLTALPDIDGLQRLTQSLAVLDAILSPDWEWRYYSFNSRWSENEKMASMRNGSGDEWFLLFSPAGAILKGFAHESPMASDTIREGVLSDAPVVFRSFLNDPAISPDGATFCIWRTLDDQEWHRGPLTFPSGSADPDGSADLLRILDGNPRTYQLWAQEYYEQEVSLQAIEDIYQHLPLTAQRVAHLNPAVSLANILSDLEEIGYPA